MIELQEAIVARLEAVDGLAFMRDAWDRLEGGGGVSRLLEDGDVFERAGVNFSHVFGPGLPPSASALRPGRPRWKWAARSCSCPMRAPAP